LSVSDIYEKGIDHHVLLAAQWRFTGVAMAALFEVCPGTWMGTGYLYGG
jgi:hypothetical protein